MMYPLLTPDLVLDAYAQGLFPMAYSGDSDAVQWICPEMRGQLSITDLHMPRSLLKAVKQAPYAIRVNTDFAGVIRACGAATDDRPETWINPLIRDVFCELHAQGHAHSVECWRDGELVGGLYGLAIGGVFCGESMFSRATNASKIALVHLAARLWAGGFEVLDTQFVNDHLEQFGVYEIPHEDYLRRIMPLIGKKAEFRLTGRREADLLRDYLAMRR